MFLRAGRIGVLLSLLTSAQAAAPLQQASPQYRFFSGQVAEISEQTLKVSRTLPGRTKESRLFSLTPETKIEGELKQAARVTVAYEAGEEGEEIARRVIVRARKAGRDRDTPAGPN